MKAIALAAVLAVPVMAAPALAGPYVETKTEVKGTDDDYKSLTNQGRVGYEWKAGDFTPYIEGGVGVKSPEGKDNETFTALEIGSKVKITKNFSAYGKFENLFQNDSTRDWKVEVGTKYKF
jgi:outer membrane receptor for ferrienterochelin and colicin